jgi:hypothetical protein
MSRHQEALLRYPHLAKIAEELCMDLGDSYTLVLACAIYWREKK